jgi:hypothetical protein
MGCFIGVGFKDRLGGSPTGDVHPLKAGLSHLKPAVRVTVVIFTVRALQANQCAATRPALGQCVCPRWHGAAGRHQAGAGARAWGLNFLRRCLLKPPDLFRTPRRAELEMQAFPTKTCTMILYIFGVPSNDRRNHLQPSARAAENADGPRRG